MYEELTKCPNFTHLPEKMFFFSLKIFLKRWENKTVKTRFIEKLRKNAYKRLLQHGLFRIKQQHGPVIHMQMK